MSQTERKDGLLCRIQYLPAKLIASANEGCITPDEALARVVDVWLTYSTGAPNNVRASKKEEKGDSWGTKSTECNPCHALMSKISRENPSAPGLTVIGFIKRTENCRIIQDRCYPRDELTS